MSEPVRRTQEERRAEAERRVLDAALTLIAARGSKSISLADVGKAAGYSRGIVNHHFGTKEELLRRVVLEAQRTIPEPPVGPTGLQRLTRLIENYLDVVLKPTTATKAFLVMWGEAIADEPSVRQLYVERDIWFRQLIADVIDEGRKDTSIRIDVDAAAAAFLILAQLRGIGLQLMLTPNKANRRQVAATSIDFLTHALRQT